MQEFISILSANDKLVTSWTAILAVFISLISIIITVVNVAMQRAHNRKSVLPIGSLSLGDYENQIFVRLRNDGVLRAKILILFYLRAIPTTSDLLMGDKEFVKRYPICV